ncbi:unnamed protein product [Oncorhynchus mykiss]|uniref:Uncharacterized protein n=1 Tax=Oncorhynchus mykiss TaxID=8022 RepID=A0A060VUQ4_ONCMY|nr:unnamed protein product [Oncorhynchus mykiss]
MRSKLLSVELRDRILSGHRSGEGYIEGLQEHIILKWKKFGTTETVPRAGQPGQTEQSGEKGLGQEGEKEPDGHSEFLCGVGRTFQKDNHLCSRCAKLVVSYPRRLEAVITAKGASTKY